MKLKLFLSNRSNRYHAEAIYDTETKEFIVKKGATVSESLSESKSFRGITSIAKKREGVVKDGVLIKDMHFRSASTAGNFVSGQSTNGLQRWKDKNGTPLKELI